MSVRNLDKLFKPRSVSLIGATPRPGSVGAVVVRNLRRAGFAGELMLVNPHHRTIDGLTVYPNVASLPQAPDLAVITTPPESVPSLIGELGERGTRAAVILTAGFGELGERGNTLQQAALDAAKPHLLRIVGPSCVGIMVPRLGLDATFSHLAAPAGDIAFLSQSGAMITAMLDWAVPRRIGFSRRVAGGYGRCRFWRHARLSRRRSRYPRHPPLSRGHHPWPKIHVGGAGGVTNQARPGPEGGPIYGGRAGRHLAHRGACRRRCRLRCRVSPRRHAAGRDDGRAVRCSG